MIWLTKEQVISLHTKLIEKTGGTDGIRDDGLLDAALHAPFHTFETNELYRSLCDKAACVWSNSKSSFCRWEQTHWRTCFVGSADFERGNHEI